MIVEIKDKEYSFDGYANPISSVQRLAEDIYQQGRADAIDEILTAIRELESHRMSVDKMIGISKVGEIVEKLKEKNNEIN